MALVTVDERRGDWWTVRLEAWDSTRRGPLKEYDYIVFASSAGKNSGTVARLGFHTAEDAQAIFETLLADIQFAAREDEVWTVERNFRTKEEADRFGKRLRELEAEGVI